MSRAARAAAVVLLALLAVAAAGGAAADGPYDNTTGGDEYTPQDWSGGHDDPTLEAVLYYASLLGTFVVGTHPSASGAGPVISGLLIGSVALARVGPTRPGLVAGGVVAVAAAAVLSQGAGLLPVWVYGVAMLAVGFVAAAVYIKALR
jgi:hypothetical protein